MKFLRPDLSDPVGWTEAYNAYRTYLDNVHFPEPVEVYLRDPETWRHGSVKCPHDFFLQSLVITDPQPGADADSNISRITVELVIACMRRKATMAFAYEAVRWIDATTSRGKWHAKLPQVVADEVTLDDGGVLHEWCLDNANTIIIKCRAFSRVVSLSHSD